MHELKKNISRRNFYGTLILPNLVYFIVKECLCLKMAQFPIHNLHMVPYYFVSFFSLAQKNYRRWKDLLHGSIRNTLT